jgi:para-aminobenzoate synthetase component 1
VFDRVHIRLDSALPGNSLWQFHATRPNLVLRCENDASPAELIGPEGVIDRWANPLDALDWMQDHIREQRVSPAARWIGYLSYDLGRLFETIPSTTRDDLKLPLFQFAFVEPGMANPAGFASQTRSSPQFSSTFSRESYCRAVERVIDYIRNGDVFQVNLSQRFTCRSELSPESVYLRLLERTPAWYGALLDFGDHALICNSPELFLHVRPDRRVITRPIKGTRPRLPGMDAELLASAKDQAELNMIIDLERSDLGRECEIGSVKVTQPRVIETHPTVYHGAATIEGILRPEVGLVDLLRATFPGGSITGAPKIRAMQIIEELEPTCRGPYCGDIGYLAPDGTMQFNVAIRTILAKDTEFHVPVGGGIVADSDPQAEYEETLIKAQAMFAALHFKPPPRIVR